MTVKHESAIAREERFPLFSRITRASLSDHIVEQITELISRGVFKPGDRMPPEKQLCQQFGVGRTSVREALRSLSAMGIVESHMGDGTFVSGSADRLLERGFRWSLLLSPKLVGDLIETRRMLEGKTVQLAAKKATPADLKEAEDSILEMRAMIAAPSDYLEQDVRFHIAIARASQNSVLLNLVDTTRGYLHAWIRELLAEASRKDLLRRTQLSIKEHERILRAIQNRDPEAARTAMDAHILSSSADLKKHLGRNVR